MRPWNDDHVIDCSKDELQDSVNGLGGSALATRPQPCANGLHDNVDECQNIGDENKESDHDGNPEAPFHNPRRILELVAKLNGIPLKKVQQMLRVMVACDEVYVRGSFVFSTYTHELFGVIRPVDGVVQDPYNVGGW